MSGGPVQLMAFGYGSAVGAEERIMAELDSLQGRGLLRLLDFLFVQKTAEGELLLLDIGDDDDYGTILAGFFPWDEDGGYEPPEPGADPDELAELAEGLEPGTAMALVLVEHLWAGGLFSAVEATGGELLSEGFITDEGEVIIGAEVEAISEAAAVIEEAHAAGAAARLEALQAFGEAAAAVETAREIRDAAAAEALGALIAAGIIEANATNEAADALLEAGVITQTAQEAEEDAFERAAEAVAAGREIETEAGAEAAEAVEEAQALSRAAMEDAAEVELEAAEEEKAAIGATDAVERAEAKALAREVVASEIAKDAARAEAQRVAEAAVVQEAAALDEAAAVTADAGLREAAAVEEVEATEHLAARLEAAAAITTAEKRLLRYLKTELTFAMIADKMGVSRGAVKDRAGRVYKKLGAHSREEAVGAAIELGVIKG